MKIIKRILGVVLCCCLLISNTKVYATDVKSNEVCTNYNDGTQTNRIKSNDDCRVYESDGYKITFCINNKWDTGYTGKFIIENVGDECIHNWCILFPFEDEITEIWNAQIISHSNGKYIIKNLEWNQDIETGNSVEFGIKVTGNNIQYPENYSLFSSQINVNKNNYEIIYGTEPYNETEFLGIITIQNKTDKCIEDWKLSFSYKNTIASIWDAEIIDRTNDFYLIKNPQYKQNIRPHQSISFSFIIRDGNINEAINDIELKEIVAKNEIEDNNIGELYYKDSSLEEIAYDQDSGIKYVKNQLLISALIGLDKNIVETLANDIGADIVGYIEKTNDYQIEFRENQSLKNLLEYQNELNDYSFFSCVTLNTVEETYIEKTIPNDDAYRNNNNGMTEEEAWDELHPSGVAWGLCAMRIPYAWDYSKEFSSVKVGVIDHSFSINNKDLKFENVNDINNCEKANHGNMVAGIIAAGWNNEKGIAGIITNANLYGYALSDKYTNKKNLISIMKEKYAYAYLILNGVKVINNSMGEAYETQYAASVGNIKAQTRIKTNANILGEFLNKFIQNGYNFIIINSAGNTENLTFIKDTEGSSDFGFKYVDKQTTIRTNESNDHIMAYYNSSLSAIELPSVKRRIIIVGAVRKGAYTSADIAKPTPYQRAPYSNVGERVDIYAPGTDVYGTSPKNNEISCNTGTSFASPHIAGIAGLMYQINPNLSAENAKLILCSNKCAIATIDDKTTGYTRNMPDAEKCVIEAKKNTKNTNISPESTGILLGCIKNVTGEKICNAKISAYTADSREGNVEIITKTTVSDQYGNYELSLPTGTYNLLISANNYLPFVMNNVEIRTSDITYLENTLMVPWSSAYKNSKIQGKVTHALTGSSIKGATVKLRKGWNNKKGKYVKSNRYGVSTRFETGENGRITIPIMPGCYTAEVSKNGFITGYYNIAATVNGAITKMILTPILSKDEYRIILTWDKDPEDLDAHLNYYQNDKQLFHIYYKDKTFKKDGKTVAKLDLDDTNGYGPETVTITINSNLLKNGEIYYAVHDYTNRKSKNSNKLSNSNAKVQVYKGNKLKESYSIPSNMHGTVWKVFKITNNGIITRNKLEYKSDPSTIK